MRELNLSELSPILGSATLNLIRRCADGSLRMSADRWQLDEVGDDRVIFRSIEQDNADEQQQLELDMDEVERMSWDRLPKQQTRSQVRFLLYNGDLWTFSGTLSPPD